MSFAFFQHVGFVMICSGVLACLVRYLEGKILQILSVDMARTATQRKVCGHTSCDLCNIGNCVAWALVEHRVTHVIFLDYGAGYSHG